MILITTFWWGDKFSVDDVNRLAAGLKRHIKQPYRFACINDKGFPPFSKNVHHSWPIIDEELTKVKGCFARLRMFDPVWQQNYPGYKMYSELYGDKTELDRIVNIDLDTIITDELDPLFDRPEPLVIMKGANKVNPCPFNGALIMLTPGAHPEVWHDFTMEAASSIPRHEFPDDQGWLWYKVPGAAGWNVGAEHGVYVWQKRGWPSGEELPEGACLVTFVNKGPRDIAHLPWVKEHWQ